MKKDISHQFAICVKNNGYEVSLEKRKVYPVLEDKKASTLSLVRILDESGSSYLYPEDCFISIKLPQLVLKAFAQAA